MSKIAVVGDITIDLFKKPGKKTVQLTKDYEKDNWELYFSDSQKLKGGALLLAEMIEKSINEEEIIFKSKEIDVFTYNESKINENEYLHTIITLNKYKSSIDECDPSNSDKEYRISHFDGFNYPISEKDDKKKFQLELGKKEESENEIEWKPIENQVDMMLIHDSVNYFRKIDEKDWINQIINNTTPETIFIHKMRYPLVEDNLWEKIFEEYGNKIKKLIVIITADDLRESGLRISRNLSWERTAFDLRRSIEKIRDGEIENKKLQNLFQLNNLNLIVRFGADGVILYQNKNKQDENDPKKYEFTLFFDPEVFEGSIEKKYPGNMKSLGVAFVAGLVLGIQKFPKKLLNNGIKDGIKKGIMASRKLYKIGFIKENIDDTKKKTKMNYPYKDMFSHIDNETDNIQDVEIYDVKIDNNENNADNSNNEDKHKNWEIIDQTFKGEEDKEEEIYQAACQIVKHGKTKNLKAPVAEFGNLSTADRSEMESYHSIKNLINEYLNNKNIKVPLSIAVFGPPGSGKSFGVTEIAKSISDDIEKLEFNLSQFQSPDDLFSAFHMVQSTSLKGKTPLVFFDEFDSKLNNEDFGWLKYFLAPMNDGKFKQGDTIHPIGKCIFVFAGGTKKTFEEFEKDKNKAKGSDFISRLRGYINIIGINSRSSGYTTINGVRYRKIESSEDKHYMIRRAMVLRNFLNKKASNIFEESYGKKIVQIDKSVLSAMIQIPEYKYGNRSMEAIIEMSDLSNRKKFVRSALPSSEQLKIHVDAEKFKELLDDSKDCKEMVSGKVLESTWMVYSYIADNIYNILQQKSGNKLKLEFMRTGSRDPDLNFKDYKNHRGDNSIEEAKKWLNKGKEAYANNKYNNASYCFGVAIHYITDAFSAPHCLDKVKIEDHRDYELQTENIKLKSEKIISEAKFYNGYQLDNLVNNLRFFGSKNIEKWIKIKDSEKSQKLVKINLYDITLTALISIENELLVEI